MRSLYARLVFLLATTMLSCLVATTPSGGQEIPAQLSSDLHKTLSTAEFLLTNLRSLHEELERLRIALQKSDPLADEIEEAIEQIPQTLDTTQDAAASVFAFNLMSATSILILDNLSLENCVTRSVYAGSLKNSSGILSDLLSKISSKEADLADASNAITKSISDIALSEKLLEELASNGFLTTQQITKISQILDAAEVTYDGASATISSVAQLLDSQKSPILDRLAIAEHAYAEFLGNPTNCYYPIAGDWEKKLASGRKAILCITTQDRFAISGYGYGITSSGKKAVERPFSGTTKNDATEMIYPGYGTFTHRIFDGGKSSARICDDPDHDECFYMSIGHC